MKAKNYLIIVFACWHQQLPGLAVINRGWYSYLGLTNSAMGIPSFILKHQAVILFTQPNTVDGTYTGFPEGIEIDDNTGAINLSKSETGLRYRITHTATDGTVTTTMVVLSGITFPDKFYHLSQDDSIALPIYNASDARVLPLNGSNFDDGNTANSGGCSSSN